MESNKELEPVEVFSGMNWEAVMIKNNLENAGIEAFINNEITGTLAPFYSSPGSTGAVKVIVSQLNYTEAKVIVDEFVNAQENS